MKRMSLPGLMIAISLALLLPIELAHCVWMGFPSTAPAGRVPSAAHACCRAAANSRPAQPAASPTAPRSCTCIQLPVVTLPSPTALAAPSIGAMLFMATAPMRVPTPIVALVTTLSRAPVLGSPPCRADLDAHGMRAPPLSA